MDRGRPLNTPLPRLAPAQPNRRRAEENNDLRRSISRKSVSCEACRTKKVKCVGQQPCDYCVKNGIECIINEERDGRRKIGLKRTMNSLERDRNLLLDLVSSMRKGENIYIEQLLNLIKSDASLDEIRSYVDVHLASSDLEQSPELEEVQNEILSQKRLRTRKDMDISKIADTPIFNVPAKPWTSATDDDTLVSHLISLYFTWHNPFYNYIHRETFIRDMQAGELHCDFCSPFLVNAILAEASALSDYPGVFAVPGNSTSRGVNFIEEARSQVGKVEDFSTLPNIQGLAALSVVMAMVGKDRLGWAYLGLAKRSAEEYERRATKFGAREPEEAVRTFSVSLNKYEPISRPCSPRPSLSHGQSWDIWSPYPQSVESFPGHMSCVANGWADLMTILAEIGKWMSSDEQPPQRDEIERVQEFHKQLQAWKVNLPACVQPDSDSVPQILYLHMQYHTIVTQVFSVAYQRGIHERDDQATRIAAAHDILKLLRIHRSKWGTQRMSSTMIHWLSAGLFTLLGALDDDENRAAFTEFAITTRSFSRRWMLSKGILRMVQLNAAKMQVALPAESQALFMDFATKDWRRTDRDFFKSFYPNLGAAQNEAGHDEYDMEQILVKWDHLRFGE